MALREWSRWALTQARGWRKILDVSVRCWIGAVLLCSACGGAPTPSSPATQAPAPAPAPEPAAPAPKSSTPALPEPQAELDGEEPALGQDIPRACAPASDPCVPPPEFTRKLCQGKFPSLALAMFSKHAPWQHAFIADEWLEPINAYGGPSTEGWMRYGEEVLLLKPPGEARSGGARVIGPDDVDILRSDGTCATVTRKALTDRYPGVTRSAPIVWKYLEEPTREALLLDKAVKWARDRHKKDCKGSSETHPHKKCEGAMKTLNQAILQALKQGLELPDPEKKPEWPVTALAVAAE